MAVAVMGVGVAGLTTGVAPTEAALRNVRHETGLARPRGRSSPVRALPSRPCPDRTAGRGDVIPATASDATT